MNLIMTPRLHRSKTTSSINLIPLEIYSNNIHNARRESICLRSLKMSETKPRYIFTESPVINLRSSKDWPDWLGHIKKTATLLGVWEYCDPTTEKEDLPVLKSPKRPHILDEDPIELLNKKDLKSLASLASKYRKERAEFNEKRCALQNIEELIRSTAGDAGLNADSYWSPAGGPWQQLRCLWDVHGRPTEQRIEELEDEWFRIQSLANNPLVQDYVHSWEKLIKACAESRILKSSSKSSRGQILLDAVMGRAWASGTPPVWTLERLPWIDIPARAGSVDDENDEGGEDDKNDEKDEIDEPKSNDEHWDFLSTTEEDTTDDRRRSRSPSIGW